MYFKLVLYHTIGLKDKYTHSVPSISNSLKYIGKFTYSNLYFHINTNMYSLDIFLYV